MGGNECVLCRYGGDYYFRHYVKEDEDVFRRSGTLCYGTSHIAARFEEGQKQEQDKHLGHKAEHRAHAGYDTVTGTLCYGASGLPYAHGGQCAAFHVGTRMVLY